MNDAQWAALGLTEPVLAELYRRGRKYAAARISEVHREDAVQNGMCRVLCVVADPPKSLPQDPDGRLNYLTRCLNEAILAMAPQDQPGPTPRLPRIPTNALSL